MVVEIGKIMKIYITIGLFLLWVLSVVLYCKFGIGKWFFHDILLWHEPIDIRDEEDYISDAVNRYSICKYCGKEIIQDSQGNWFSKEDM